MLLIQSKEILIKSRQREEKLFFSDAKTNHIINIMYLHILQVFRTIFTLKTQTEAGNTASVFYLLLTN